MNRYVKWTDDYWLVGGLYSIITLAVAGTWYKYPKKEYDADTLTNDDTRTGN